MDSNTAALGFIVSRHHLSADVGIRASEGSGLRVVCVVPHASFSSHGEATGKDNRGVLMVGSVPARAYHADGLCTTIPFDQFSDQGIVLLPVFARCIQSQLVAPAINGISSVFPAVALQAPSYGS